MEPIDLKLVIIPAGHILYRISPDESLQATYDEITAKCGLYFCDTSPNLMEGNMLIDGREEMISATYKVKLPLVAVVGRTNLRDLGVISNINHVEFNVKTGIDEIDNQEQQCNEVFITTDDLPLIELIKSEPIHRSDILNKYETEERIQ